MTTSWLLFESLLSGAFRRKVIKSIPPRLPDIVYIYCFLSLPPSLSVCLSVYVFLSSPLEAADRDVCRGRKKEVEHGSNNCEMVQRINIHPSNLSLEE